MAAQNSSFRAQYGVSIVWVFNVFGSKGCLWFSCFYVHGFFGPPTTQNRHAFRLFFSSHHFTPTPLL